MGKINVKIAQAHENQMRNFDVQREMKSVQNYFDTTELDFNSEAVSLMFLSGQYNDFAQTMNTALVFVNKMGQKISELHGVIHIHTNTEGIQFAKTTIDFDEEFMGVLCDNEGLLVHLNIPVRGLEGNRTFTEKELEVQFADVRVTYANKQCNMKQILEKYLAITLVLVLMTGCGSAADKEIMTAKEFQKKWKGWN